MNVKLSLAAPTYLGLIDDAVGRYPWPGTGPSLPLDDVLFQYLLFGATLIVNDGYVVANDECRAALSRPDSLFNLLAVRGILRIASTRTPPSASIIARAEAGVTGHRQLVSRADWPEIADRIDGLESLISPSGIAIPWPRRDLSRNFAAMTARLLDRKSAKDILTLEEKAFVERFLGRMASRPSAPRTQWEEMAVNEVGSAGAQAQLLQLANQIYHLNFAAGLGCEGRTSMSVASWVDERTTSLLGRADLGIEKAVLEAPVLRYDRSAASVVARRLLDDRKFLDLRDAFLDNWQNSDARSAYAEFLSQAGDGGSDQVAPPSVLAFGDPEEVPRLIAWRTTYPAVETTTNPTGVMRIFLSAHAACLASTDPTPFPARQ